MTKKIEKLLKKNNQGVKIDLGCGARKQEGFIGIDNRKLPGVDIVQDLEKFPWSLPDRCANFLVSSHVLEHINPHGGVFLKFMDEAWRILKPKGRFAFVVPYAGSPGYWQDPTHCNGITEATMGYFDPEDISGLWRIYKTKPWKIINSAWSSTGNLEVMLEKRDEKKYKQKKV